MTVLLNRKARYEKAKHKLLNDKSIHARNREFWAEFLAWEENKLKRTNRLATLDEAAYKTLYFYLVRFRNIDKWFEGKPWADLTKADIQRVYEALEEGTITNKNGERFKAREDYYSKIFKSKPFEMIGKADIAREVIEYSTKEDREVRFIWEADFRKLVNAANKTEHKALLWLAWDIGENITALLQLRKRDFQRQLNDETKEPEYLVNLRKEILKRTRRARGVLTNHDETTEYLDLILADLGVNDTLFPYDYQNAKKIIDRAVAKSKVKVTPTGNRPTWKDLRSGMACDLLIKGWAPHEINGRLGHSLNSDEINRYITFLAIDSKPVKKKLTQFKAQQLHDELDAMREREKLAAKRYAELQAKVADHESSLELLIQAKIAEAMKKAGLSDDKKK